MSTFMPTTVSNAAVIAVSGWKQSLGSGCFRLRPPLSHDDQSQHGDYQTPGVAINRPPKGQIGHAGVVRLPFTHWSVMS